MFNYDKLAGLIESSGKSKAYLCRKVGKPEYYLRDVIKQKNKIPDDIQAILAEELNVTVEYLNDLDEKKPAVAADSELIPGYSDLSEGNKAKAREYIALLLSSQQSD